MATHNDFGKQAEEAAEQYLIEKGYLIQAKNFIFGKGEIDLITMKNNWLVFVEVRARSDIQYGFPEQTISKAKASLIVKTAEQYVYKINWNGKIRFDIIAITVQDDAMNIEHFEDVFF